MYAQQINGVWTELRGNIVFSDTVYQTAESLSDEQRAKFGVVPLVVAPAPELLPSQKYADPTYTFDGLVVTKLVPVLDKTPEEIEAERKAAVPYSVTMRQGRLAMLATSYGGGTLLDVIETMLDSIPDPIQRRAARIDWEYAQEIKRDFPLVQQLTLQLDMTEHEIDALFTKAGIL